MLSRVVGLTFFGVLSCSLAFSQVVIKTATKDGQVVSGSFKLSVIVESQSLVSQVEFYNGDTLASTDDSTPYEFTIDTLNLDDGPLVITVAAYSRSGESAKLNLKLKVDNGLALGSAHHVSEAEKYLTEQKWALAVRSARIALKIEPNNNDARMAIARGYYGSSSFDLAQKFAEDAVKSEPSNLAAHELLSAIGLKQAFNAMQYGAGDDRTLETITRAIKASTKSKNDAFAKMIENFGEISDKNRTQYADLLNEAGRYSLVVDELTPVFNRDERDSEIADRLAYAMIRTGRYKEAQAVLRRHTRVGGLDAYGFALQAIIEDWNGNDKASLAAEQEALLSDPSNIGVRTAQAFLALRRGNIATMESIVQRLSNANQFSAVTNYYLASLYFIQSKFEPSQEAFQTALLSNPSMYHVYIERFNQAMAYYLTRRASGADATYQLKFAKTFALGALEAKPESFEALNALAIVSLYEGNIDEAVRLAQAAVSAGSQYASAHYTLSAALMLARKLDAGLKSMKDAGKLDVKWLNGLTTPSIDEAWKYFYVRGRTPLLGAPGS